MPKFSVTVEKKLRCSGIVEVTARDSVDAIEKINRKIRTGKLQTFSITWGDGEYEEFSFSTTGDVD
jgi:hypothetical protein